MKKCSCLFLLLLLVTQQGLTTDVYRIVDENGRVNYSQIPPYKGAEKVKLKNNRGNTQAFNSNDNVSLQERQKKFSDFLESERLERKQKRDEAKQQREDLAANCFSVNADLSDMNQGGVQYYDLDDSGQRVYIDQAVIDARKSQLQKYLDENCRSIIK